MHGFFSLKNIQERLYTLSIIAMQVCVKYQFSFMNDRLTKDNKTLRENFLTLTTYMFGFIGSFIGAFFARKYIIHREIIFFTSVLICINSLFLSNSSVSKFIFGSFYLRFQNTLDYIFYVFYGIVLNAFYVVFYTLQINYANNSENKNEELQLARFSEKMGNLAILTVIFLAEKYYSYFDITKEYQIIFSPFISSFFCFVSLLMILYSGIKFLKEEEQRPSKKFSQNSTVWMRTFNFYFFVILMFLYSIHNIFFNYVNFGLIQHYGFAKADFSKIKIAGVFYEIFLIAYFSKIIKFVSYESLIIFTACVKVFMCFPFAFNYVEKFNASFKFSFFIFLDLFERTTVALFTSSIPQIILQKCDKQTYVYLELIKSVIQFTIAYGAVGILCAYSINANDISYNRNNIRQLHMTIFYFMILMVIFSILYFLSRRSKIC